MVSAFRRIVALTGVLGTLSIGLAGTPAGLVGTAGAAGGGGCGGAGGGGPTPGPVQVFASHFSGLDAALAFTSISGTIETDAFVDAFQGQVTLAATGPTPMNSVFAGITVTDLSNGNQLVEAFGCISNPDFQIDQALTSAMLAPTSIMLVDLISNNASTVTVSGNWSGVGVVTRVTQASHFHTAGFTTTFDFTGFSRQADASGTVTDQELNVSLSAPDFAQLDKVEAGGVGVCFPGSC